MAKKFILFNLTFEVFKGGGERLSTVKRIFGS
jgi:hypothetical protein